MGDFVHVDDEPPVNLDIHSFLNTPFLAGPSILKRHLGSGTSCDVFLGHGRTQDAASHLSYYAVKICKRSSTGFYAQTLKQDAVVLKALNKSNLTRGRQGKFQASVPAFLAAGTVNCRDGAIRPFVTMTYCGEPLSELELPLSFNLVRKIALSLLSTLQAVHEMGLVHRDIKPENIVIKPRGHRADLQKYVLVDWALSTTWENREPRDWKFIGSLLFASREAHRGTTYSRLADIESLGYMLAFLFLGELPWDNCSDYDDAHTLKENTTTEDLCHNLPNALKSFMAIIKILPPEAEPPYSAMHRLFQDLADA